MEEILGFPIWQILTAIIGILALMLIHEGVKAWDLRRYKKIAWEALNRTAEDVAVLSEMGYHTDPLRKKFNRVGTILKWI